MTPKVLLLYYICLVLNRWLPMQFMSLQYSIGSFSSCTKQLRNETDRAAGFRFTLISRKCVQHWCLLGMMYDSCHAFISLAGHWRCRRRSLRWRITSHIVSPRGPGPRSQACTRSCPAFGWQYIEDNCHGQHRWPQAWPACSEHRRSHHGEPKQRYRPILLLSFLCYIFSSMASAEIRAGYGTSCIWHSRAFVSAAAVWCKIQIFNRALLPEWNQQLSTDLIKDWNVPPACYHRFSMLCEWSIACKVHRDTYMITAAVNLGSDVGASRSWDPWSNHQCAGWASGWSRPN